MSKVIYSALDAEIDKYIEEQDGFGTFKPEKTPVIKEPETEKQYRKSSDIVIINKKGGEKKMNPFLEASRNAEVKVIPLNFEDKLKLVLQNKRDLIKAHETIMGIDRIAIRTTSGYINRHKDACEYKIIIERLYEAI